MLNLDILKNFFIFCEFREGKKLLLEPIASANDASENRPSVLLSAFFYKRLQRCVHWVEYNKS